MQPDEETLYGFVEGWLDDVYSALGWPNSRRVRVEEIWNKWEIGAQLREVAALAGGAAPSLPEDQTQRACELLVQIGNGKSEYSDPDWWGTPVGQTVLNARLALSKDELITSSEAAQLLGVPLPVLNLIVKRKSGLQGYSLGSKIRNPQHRMRFLRRDVEGYRQIMAERKAKRAESIVSKSQNRKGKDSQ